MKLRGECRLDSVFEHCQNYVNTTNHIKDKILKYSANRLVATFFLLTKSEENAMSVCDLRRYVPNLHDSEMKHMFQEWSLCFLNFIFSSLYH